MWDGNGFLKILLILWREYDMIAYIEYGGVLYEQEGKNINCFKGTCRGRG